MKGYAGLWGNAMRDALHGDTRELSKLLVSNPPPPEVSRFLGWLSAPRKNGRPPIPDEFKWLNQDFKIYDAVLDFEIRRTNWYAREEAGRFPRAQMLEKMAKSYDVSVDALDSKLRRGRASGRKIRLIPY